MIYTDYIKRLEEILPPFLGCVGDGLHPACRIQISLARGMDDIGGGFGA